MLPDRLRPQPRARTAVLRLAAVLVLVPGAVAAQDPDPAADTSAVVAPIAGADTVPAAEPEGYDEFRGRVSPRGAFLRAALVPGWGHAAIGVHGRGGFYLGVQAVASWMVVRSLGRIDAAEDLEALRSATVRARLADEGVTDPFEVEQALEDDEAVADARSLVAARRRQFEDWLALGIFTVLLSGADAFVSAHLQPFPDLTVMPVGDGTGVEVGLRVPVGPGGGR